MSIRPSFRARKPLAMLTLALLSSCVAPPREAPRPAPAPAPAPAPTPQAPALSSDWTQWPMTAGSWTYRPQASGGVAPFSSPQGDVLAAFRCDLATRRVVVTRAGMAAQNVTAMSIRTTFGTVQWPASAEAAPVSQIIAARGASDQVLDQIAYSRGRFTIEVPGMTPLVLPPWAEIARVIEDCRG